VVGIDLLEVWDEIKHKFELCEDGKLRNPKLEKVRQIQIDYRNKQSEAGKRGASKRWDNKPNGNPNIKNVALHSSSSSSDLKDLVEKKLLDILVSKSGKKFKPVESNLKFLRGRLKEGHTEEDIIAVIERKIMEWKDDPSMKQYIRPATLFNAEKFNQYIGEVGAPLPDNNKTKQAWEKVPREDDKLVHWAKEHRFSRPSPSASYFEYRSKLNIEVELRQNQERDKDNK